jgi:PAS domain S-box-containing protein
VADTYGLPMRDLVGKTDFDLFPESEAEKLWKLEKEVLEKKKTVIVPEEKYYSASGKIKYLHSTKMPFFLNEKDEIGLLGVNLDITENKEAERAIRESEAKYKMLMEQASDGIVISDKEGYVTEANARACEMFGYSLSDFKSMNLSSLLTEDEDGGEDSHWYLKQSVILERSFRRKDGKTIMLEMSTKSLPDGRNQAILRDITERKEMEKVLTESERKFRVLIENSSDIIAILSDEFNFKFISSSAERILGFAPDFLEGKPVSQFVIDDDKRSFTGLLKESLLFPGKNLLHEEVRWKCQKQKENKVLEIVVVNLLNDPAINGIVINCHDITKRKITESELINTNFELDSFVYKASHDLKAPLRSIMGLIKLARLENQDEVQHNYLNMMSKSVSSLDQFIKDLTQFSRNNRLDIEAKLIDFDALVLEALNNLQFFDHADKVKIYKKFNASVNFYSDLTRISTILNNLISNAFKYHRFENNNPYINIEIETTFEFAEIKIQDNGQGIDSRYLGRIFEMFYRASELSYGSGLGLYIVKNAVTRLDGEIRVSSVLNEGSEFTVKLPNLINDIQK